MKTQITKILSLVGIVAMHATTSIEGADTIESVYNQPFTNKSSEELFDNKTPPYTLFAEYLLWKPSSQSLFLAATGIPQGTEALKKQGEVFSPKTASLSGLRVGGKKQLSEDKWDLNVSYTWLAKNPKKMNLLIEKAEDPIMLNIGRFQNGNENIPYVESLSSRWKYSFQNIDLDIGKSYLAGSALSVRPHVGIKWVETKNSLKVVMTEEHLQNQFSQTFCGIGIRTGFSSAFYWNKWLSIYSNCSLSAPYGKAAIEQKWIGGETPAITGNVKNSAPVIAPIIETSLGLRFATPLCEEAYQLLLQAGWEEQIILNHFHFLMMNNLGSMNNSLSQQGLCIRASFSF